TSKQCFEQPEDSFLVCSLIFIEDYFQIPPTQQVSLNSSQFLALFETFQRAISDSVHYSFPKTLHIAPKELLTLSPSTKPSVD
ncbi:hypothetical protein, partial [Streptococcus pseudopneumoniae]|uniref:hypothetical protein n=7 Tax=Streptococcus TaxID=1301 RepID=UPI001C3F1E79